MCNFTGLMMSGGTISTTAIGVLEELFHDFGDVAWVVLEMLGVTPIIVRLREELQRSSSYTRGFDPLTGLPRIHNRRRRSIVRILGSALPLNPVARPYLRLVLLIINL